MYAIRSYYDFVSIAAVLASNQLDVSGKVLVDHRVIEHEETVWRLNYLTFHILPHEPGSNFIPGQVTVGCRNNFV